MGRLSCLAAIMFLVACLVVSRSDAAQGYSISLRLHNTAGVDAIVLSSSGVQANVNANTIVSLNVRVNDPAAVTFTAVDAATGLALQLNGKSSLSVKPSSGSGRTIRVSIS